MLYYKIFPSIAKRIITVQDLNDFFAYMENFYIPESYKSQENYLANIPTYLFPTSELTRLDKLQEEMDYEVGAYNLDNVKRILGRYYRRELVLLFKD